MLPVCRVTKYRVPAFLDTLAAAYAEAGDFDAAVATLQQALIIVRSNPVLSARDLEQRLALYRAGKAYHEPLSP